MCIRDRYNPYAEKEDIDKISKEIGSNSNVENFTKVNVQKATVEKNNEVLDLSLIHIFTSSKLLDKSRKMGINHEKR